MEKKEKYQIYFKTFGGNVYKQEEVFIDAQEAQNWVDNKNNTIYDKRAMYFFREVKEQELEK